MSKKVKDILYNPGSIHTIESNDNSYNNTTGHHKKDFQKDTQFLYNLETLVTATDFTEIYDALSIYHYNLKKGISKGLHLSVLREFNRFLQRTSHVYNDNRLLFIKCLEVITETKNCFESGQGLLQKEEWIELEKSLYVLSTWESGLPLDDEARLLN